MSPFVFGSHGQVIEIKGPDEGGKPFVDYLPEEPDDPDEIKKTCEFIARFYGIAISSVRYVEYTYNDGTDWLEWGQFQVLRNGEWENHGLPDEVTF